MRCRHAVHSLSYCKWLFFCVLLFWSRFLHYVSIYQRFSYILTKSSVHKRTWTWEDLLVLHIKGCLLITTQHVETVSKVSERNCWQMTHFDYMCCDHVGGYVGPLVRHFTLASANSLHSSFTFSAMVTCYLPPSSLPKIGQYESIWVMMTNIC